MKKTIVMILALTVGMTAKADVIEIGTKSELLSFMNSWSNSNTYKLTADIDLENDSWTPVGQPNTNEFNTTFDGQGHKISNIKVTASTSGFFGVIGTRGIVQNLTIEKGEMRIYEDGSETVTQCGAIAGINRGIITDCVNKNTAVYGNHHSASVGGIAGDNDNYGTINNCCNFYGLVYTHNPEDGFKANFLGGITGENYSGATVSNCFVCAEIANNLYYGGTYGPIIADEKNFGTATNNSYLDYYEVYNFSDQTKTTYTTIPGYTLYKDGAWNTLCLPLGLTPGQVTAQLNPTSLMELDTEGWYDNTGTPYATEAEGLRQTSFEPSTGTLYLYFKPATAIEAGKPYIIKWASGDNLVKPSFEGVTISSLSLQNVTKNLGSGMSITFKGCFSPISVSGPSYLFLSSNDELYYPSSAKIIGSCRAYFELSGLTAGDTEKGARSIRAFSLNFNDESTGIVEVRKEEGAGNHVNASLPEYFTINGVKLTGKPTAKGLYIRSTPAGQQGKKDSRIIVIK